MFYVSLGFLQQTLQMVVWWTAYNLARRPDHEAQTFTCSLDNIEASYSS